MTMSAGYLSEVSGEPRQECLYLRLGLIATVGDLQADAVDQGLPMRGRGCTYGEERCGE